MGITTDFIGTLTTSRPLTDAEIKEYEDARNNDMYLIFVEGSNNELEGPQDEKVAGYVDMEKGFMATLNWLKSKGITLIGRINYSSEYILSEHIGLGFGAFVATPENVTYHKLDFTNLQMVSSVIYQTR